MLGVAFLQVGRISQNDMCQVDSGRCGPDGAAEALLDQAWQISHVIQVCVSEENVRNGIGRDWKIRPVLAAEFFLALIQA